MNKKLKLAAVLAVVLLALGGLATWDEWKTKQEQADDKTKNKLADFKPEEVIELDYYSKGGDDAGAQAKADDNPKADQVVQVSAVKKDGVWRVTKPIDSLADGVMIENLIKTVTDYAYSKVITEKRDQWADFGLLEPSRHLTLRVGGDSPRAFTVFIGNKAPVGYNAYLRTSKDDRVLMGSQHILISTSKTLNDFRDKTLAKIDEAKVKNLKYERQGEPEIEITKTDGKYAIVKPEKLEADGGSIKDFIDELNAVKVVNFVDGPADSAKAAFAKPDFVVTWQGETGEASTLKFAENAGKLVAAFDPNQRIYVLPDEVKTKLKKELTDFRNRRIMEPDSLDAKTVEIDGDVYKNIEGDWYAAADAGKFDDKGKFNGAPKDKPAEKANLRAFMVDLEFAKTDRFLPLTDAAVKSLPAAPMHRITLQYHDPAKKPVTIDLFKSDVEDKYIVRRSGANFVYRVPKSAFNSMTPGNGPVPGAKTPPVEGNPENLPLDEEGGAGDSVNLPGDNQSSGMLTPPYAAKTV